MALDFVEREVGGRFARRAAAVDRAAAPCSEGS